MGAEIERKFLLRDDGAALVAGLPGMALQQGYFGRIDGWSVRLRTAVSQLDGAAQAWLTLKTTKSGSVRQEIERTVSVDFAQALLATARGRLISKLRYRLPQGDLCWEIDRFQGAHKGLWLAEIELPRADYPLDLPSWLGAEVTDDTQYRNEALAAADGQGARIAAPADLVAAVRRMLQQTGQTVTMLPRGRDARLAANLRSNLLRRKQQARNREDRGAEPVETDPPGAENGTALDREDGSA